MKKLFIILGILFFVVACQKFRPPENDTVISEHDEDESHETGANCMNCHNSAGYGEGFFTVAGSMYGNTINADVEVYSDMDEPPILTVAVDRLGNAYTTEAIDFGDGLYVAVRSADGEREWMEDKIYNGQCNMCHGTSIEERIEID